MNRPDSALVNAGNISQIMKNIVLGQTVYFELVDKESSTVRRAMNTLKSYQPKVMKSLSLSLNHCIDINTHNVTLLIRVTCTNDHHKIQENTTFPKREKKARKSAGTGWRRKITEQDSIDIKKALREKTPVAELAEKYRVSKQTIYNLRDN